MSQTVLAEGPIVWVVPSSLVRIAPTETAGVETTAAISAARGEYQSFQVAIQAPVGGLTELNFSVSNLVRVESNAGENEDRGSGDQVILQENVALYREKYMTVRQHSPTYNGPPNLPITNIDTFPDALIPFIDPATGVPPVGGTYVAAPINLAAGHNAVFWADVLIPHNAKAGRYKGIYTVTSKQGSVQGQIHLTVWNFTLPLKPSLKSLIGGGDSNLSAGGALAAGIEAELLSNRLMPDTSGTALASESTDISQYGLNDFDLGYYENVSYSNCNGKYLTPAPPTLAVLQSAVNAQPTGLYLNDYTADPESSCTNTAFYDSVIAWAQVLHQVTVPGQVGVDNLVSQQPVPQLYDDGLGTGRSAVDIWTMLPQNYNDAEAEVPPAVTFVLKKGDKAWSYNDLVQDSYSPKWELDFLPIDYRIQAGFISQSLGLTGLNYWAVTEWTSPSTAWTNPQGYADYPGEGILVYPGGPAGLERTTSYEGVAPSMRLKDLRDGVQDYEYIQILKDCGHGEWALERSRDVGRDWTNWTRDSMLLESVRRELGNKIAALGCSR